MAASLRAAAVLCLRDLKREAVDLGHQCLGQPEGKTLPGGTLDFLPGNGFAIAGRYVVYVHFTFMPCFVTHFAVRNFFCLKSICKYWGRRIEMYPTYYIDGLYFSTFHADVKVTCVQTARNCCVWIFPKRRNTFSDKSFNVKKWLQGFLSVCTQHVHTSFCMEKSRKNKKAEEENKEFHVNVNFRSFFQTNWFVRNNKRRTFT